MDLMVILVVVGGLYFVGMLTALLGFCWWVVLALQGIAVEQERTKERLESLLAHQQEHDEHDE